MEKCLLCQKRKVSPSSSIADDAALPNYPDFNTMTKEIIIIALVIALIYLYHQNKKRLNSTDPNYQQAVSETIANLKAEIKDLVTDKDSAVRTKNKAEQELLSVNNRLKLKQQEVTRKDQEIERLKSEKNRIEVNLNQKITEWKTKYSKQGQLLDKEQTDNNKLNEKVEKLENKVSAKQTKIVELTRSKSPMPGEFPAKDLTQEHQTQLRKIYALFDLRANGFKEIDFNQLMSMLQGVKKKVDKK